MGRCVVPHPPSPGGGVPEGSGEGPGEMEGAKRLPFQTQFRGTDCVLYALQAGHGRPGKRGRQGKVYRGTIWNFNENKRFQVEDVGLLISHPQQDVITNASNARLSM